MLGLSLFAPRVSGSDSGGVYCISNCLNPSPGRADDVLFYLGALTRVHALVNASNIVRMVANSMGKGLPTVQTHYCNRHFRCENTNIDLMHTR